jgi:DNA-directed RNA polymerase subunit RPC12/RpoP
MKCLSCGQTASQYGPSDPHRYTGDVEVKYRCPSCGWRTYVSVLCAEACEHYQPKP